MNIDINNIIKIINKSINKFEVSLELKDEDLSNLGMDSISFITLIVLLEEELKIEIPDEYLIFEKMNTINKIYNVIQSI
ncbi:acyl carrier protein (plasmid) [Clostridium perfringens]|uniref:acyl carrier protein n=1 Tax=Clostridium perfringens TaxID=1502 RepID=UPI0030D1636A